MNNTLRLTIANPATDLEPTLRSLNPHELTKEPLNFDEAITAYMSDRKNKRVPSSTPSPSARLSHTIPFSPRCPMKTASLPRPSTPAPSPSIGAPHPPRAFRAIFRKSLHEGFPIIFGAWLLAIFCGLVLASTMTYSFRRPQRIPSIFMDSELLGFAAFGFPLVGFLFGIFQFHGLQSLDAWAFFVHRPISRARLFLLSVTAGLSIYVLAVLLPIGIFLAWMIAAWSIPANDINFLWAFLYPYLISLLTGITAYFCGAILGQRPDRWAITCPLSFFGVVFLCVLSLNVHRFSAVLTIELIGTAAYALAAFGNMKSHGTNERLPFAPRAGLLVMLFCGVLLFGSFINLKADDLLWAHGNALAMPESQWKITTPYVLPDGQIAIGTYDLHDPTSSHFFSPTGQPLNIPPRYGIVVPLGAKMQFPSTGYIDLITLYPWNSWGQTDYRNLDSILDHAQHPSTPAPPKPDPKKFYLYHNAGDERIPDMHGQITDDYILLTEPATQTTVTLPITHELDQYRLTLQASADRQYFHIYYNLAPRHDGLKQWFGRVFHGRTYAERFEEVYDRSGKLISSAVEDPVLNLLYAGTNWQTDEYATHSFGKPLLILIGLTHSVGMSLPYDPLDYWLGLGSVPDTSYNYYWNPTVFFATWSLNLAVAATFILLCRRYRLPILATLLWSLAGLLIGPLLLIVFLAFHHRPSRTPGPHSPKPRPVTVPLCPHCKTPSPRPPPTAPKFSPPPA